MIASLLGKRFVRKNNLSSSNLAIDEEQEHTKEGQINRKKTSSGSLIVSKTAQQRSEKTQKEGSENGVM